MFRVKNMIGVATLILLICPKGRGDEICGYRGTQYFKFNNKSDLPANFKEIPCKDAISQSRRFGEGELKKYRPASEGAGDVMSLQPTASPLQKRTFLKRDSIEIAKTWVLGKGRQSRKTRNSSSNKFQNALIDTPPRTSSKSGSGDSLGKSPESSMLQTLETLEDQHTGYGLLSPPRSCQPQCNHEKNFMTMCKLSESDKLTPQQITSCNSNSKIDKARMPSVSLQFPDLSIGLQAALKLTPMDFSVLAPMLAPLRG